ncbi:hypothetical protein F5Y18DRAFT_434835 [Xylariaceae sp. FL1019]|nr:hypothetical protein F5Y18DRAFT_434835 [Xylariaceae sp. FL1019]
MESPSVYEKLLKKFYTQDGANVVVVCREGAEVLAHYAVFKNHSPILLSMMEKTVDEKGRLIFKIELPDVDFHDFYMVLQWLYGGNYKDYDNFGSYNAPSNVLSLNWEEIDEKLQMLPCDTLELNLESELYPDKDYEPDPLEIPPLQEPWSGKYDEKDDISYYVEDDALGTEPADKGDEEDDGGRSRSFEGHNLFDSLRVYNLARRFGLRPLMLIARDRFYRTAEKVLLHLPDGKRKPKVMPPWVTHDQQRVYRAKLIKAVYDDFPKVCEEVYDTVPYYDPMRQIPTMLIAAGYNNKAFREHMRPLLEMYLGLEPFVVECARIPNEEDTSGGVDEMMPDADEEVLDGYKITIR